MKKFLIILFWSIWAFFAVQGQDKKFPQISQEIFAQANTADTVNYLTPEEKRVIYLVNLARIDGGLFVETYLGEYLKAHPSENTPEAVQTLKEDLKNQKTEAILPSAKLWASALFHAEDTGSRGLVQHDSSDGTPFGKRLRRYVKGGAIAENCSYGFDTAEGILMQLLIDNSTPGRGHRKNILSPSYKFIGVSIKPHKQWSFTCVQDFSSSVE